jgi:hypothetical protein
LISVFGVFVTRGAKLSPGAGRRDVLTQIGQLLVAALG